MPPKNSGGSTKFPGGHRVIHRTAQTAFVRVVIPRKNTNKAYLESSSRHAFKIFYYYFF